MCVFDISSKYAWVVPLKDKKDITITDTFQTFLIKSRRKPNKIWVDKGRKFQNRTIKSWLEKNDIEMHSTHYQGKSLVPKIFIRTLNN